jgi:hypothetical protein
MAQRLKSYTVYSVGCAIIWAVVLSTVAAIGTTTKLHAVLLVFAGWVIGWTSATIARSVYPPPRPRGTSKPTSAS